MPDHPVYSCLLYTSIVTLKDFFKYEGSREAFQIRELLRAPYFTYEYQKTSDLLIQMRENSINITIVLDEYGATAGIITLEDLLEEIVGEIRDEYDEDEVDSIPVSYTHLPYGGIFSAGGGFRGHRSGSEPVSYTHLGGPCDRRLYRQCPLCPQT